MNFQIIKQAGLYHRELGALAGVSRVTATLWVNGHQAPGKRTEADVQALLDRIKAAVDAGQLPVAKGVGPLERKRRIEAALAPQ